MSFCAANHRFALVHWSQSAINFIEIKVSLHKHLRPVHTQSIAVLRTPQVEMRAQSALDSAA